MYECGSVRSMCTLYARCAPHCELHVVRVDPVVVCDDVVRRTLVLIAL